MTAATEASELVEFPRVAERDPRIFPGLRGVTADQLDKVMAGLSHDDWEWLAAGYLDHVFGLAHDILYGVLGFDFEDDESDALDLFFRIRQAYDAHRAGGGRQ